MAQCITPITIRNPKAKLDKRELQFINVPCGKCPPCITRRVRGWMFRLRKEQEVSISSSFVTLTYDDEHLPFTENGSMTLQTSDIQQFMKRLRKHIHTNLKKYQLYETIPLKYYAVGEYGDNTHRPHYHYILFNLPDRLITDESIIQSIWGKGIIQVAVCNDNTIAYVTGYVSKKIYADKKVGLDPLDDRHPEQSYMSKGLGKNYLTKSIHQYYQKLLSPYIVEENGQKSSMPRYFRYKIYNDHERMVIAKKTKIYIEENYPYKNIKNEIEHKNKVFNEFRKKQNLKQKPL